MSGCGGSALVLLKLCFANVGPPHKPLAKGTATCLIFTMSSFIITITIIFILKQINYIFLIFLKYNYIEY